MENINLPAQHAIYVEMRVATELQIRILRTLNEIALKLQDSSHVMSQRSFDELEIINFVKDLRAEYCSNVTPSPADPDQS